MKETRFQRHGEPEPEIEIMPVGPEPRMTYHVDRGVDRPVEPETFDAVGTAQVKLAVAGNDLDGELGELADEAMTAINDLVAAMTDEYVDDRESHDWYDLYMGDLSVLPGVEKEVDYPGESERA